MSARSKAEAGVNRLLDIVVEEVSLVDRAANKHRFLIVKRSNDMDETTTDAATTAADETEDAQDLAAEADDEETAGDAGQADGSAGADVPLDAALAALEGLTEAVEILGTAGGDAAKPRLVEIASELKTVSDQLAGFAGASPGGSGAGGPDGAMDKPPQPAAATADPLAAAIASVRATLQRVSADLGARGKPRDAGAAAGSGVKPAEAAAGDRGGAAKDDAGGDGVAAQLGELTKALRTLTDTVTAQQQRLGRIEKRFGLPNSAPSGERPAAKPDDADVGWPLDLNRPFDRESVDKATSFHDL